MTKYCLSERKKVYDLYLKYFKSDTIEDWKEYINAVDDFFYRFKKRFDPLNLTDDYDIFGYTLYREEGKPFIPMELR